MQQNEIKVYCTALLKDINKLIVYRRILECKVINKLEKLLEELAKTEPEIAVAEKHYYEICSDILSAKNDQNYGSSIWKEYFFELLAKEENSFTLTCHKNSELNTINVATLNDFKILHTLLNIKWIYIEEQIQSLFSLELISDHLDNVPVSNGIKHLISNCEQASSAEELLKVFSDYYKLYGVGIFGFYQAFRWDSVNRCLTGIPRPDNFTFEKLIGYHDQKELLIGNTKAFIEGKPANNILLFGDKGTGKSSSIKALLNKFADTRLRLVEIAKHQLVNFNEILNKIRNLNLRFIVFIDDLSFEEFETEYKYLKALIEGGIEEKPANVLVYATSNRRHLIKETWAERDKNSGDVHVTDALQEKLSLVDRFGITISFTTPDQEEYLRIVRELAAYDGLNLSDNELREQALQWAMWHNGRSGRTARQFINYLLGQFEK